MRGSVTFRPLTREGTNFLKGIAILLIALHNYYRWITPMTGENEFEFSRLTTIKNFILVYSNPLELIHVFFSFLGHYGVQAFIVISAYGLTRSFKLRQPGYGKYLLHRIDKLYPPLWFAAIAFILFNILVNSQMINTETLKNIGLQLTLFANLIPGKAMAVSGPWWFWSFIFGFYLVFPAIFRLYRKTGVTGLVGIVIAGYLFSIFAYSPLRSVNLNPYMMFAGHLPELCLGIFLADRENVKFPWWVILISAVLFVGGNWFEWLWPFANLGVSVLLLLLINWLYKWWHSGILYEVITFIGAVSLYIFALQGFVRNPFLGLAGSYGMPLVSLFSGILFMVVISGLAWLMMKVEEGTRRWIAAPEGNDRKMIRFFTLFVIATVPFIVLVLTAGNPSEKKSLPEKVVFTGINNFETPDKIHPDRFTGTVYFTGKSSYELPYPESFSPFLIADLGKTDPDGVVRAISSAMICAPDPAETKVVLVFEVWFNPTNERVDWQQEVITAEKLTKEKWTLCKFIYSVPKEYQNKSFSFKTYLWSLGKAKVYADDLKLEVLAVK